MHDMYLHMYLQDFLYEKYSCAVAHQYVLMHLYYCSGGSNFRVLLIKIKDGEISQIDKKLVIDNETKTSSQERLFNFIVDCLKEFVAEQKLTEKLPLGFTFSFPVHQTSLVSGSLMRWTKDFDADGAVGENVVKLLRDAVKRRGVSVCI